MKKLLCFIFALCFIFTLTACGGDNDSSSSESSSSASGKTVIKYTGWNLGTVEENNLVRRSIARFNTLSKTTKIEIVEAPVEGYDDFLQTLAAGKNLPDVFMVNNVPNMVISKLAKDITAETQSDTEWNDIEKALRESITYNNKTYAIPLAQNYLGLFANMDLIDEYISGTQDAQDVFVPGSFSTQKWIDTVKEVKEINKIDGSGVIGMKSAGDMINWLPSTLDTTGTIKHFVWDGTKLDFTNQLMKDALAKIQDIGSLSAKFTFDNFTDEEMDANFGIRDGMTLFRNGQMGFIEAGSWENFSKVKFNYKFIGYPDGKVLSAPDFLCISNATKNAELAYEVAKFLSFGEEGIKVRFDLLDKNPNVKDLSLQGLPINTKKELSDEWFEHLKVEGVQEVYEKVVNGDMEVIVEGLKTIPGFQTARYTFNTGVQIDGVREGAPLNIGDFIWDTCRGVISMSQYNSYMTQQLADRINEEISKAFASMNVA